MARGSGGSVIYINKKDKLVIAIAATIVSKHVDRQKLIEKIQEILENRRME